MAGISVFVGLMFVLVITASQPAQSCQPVTYCHEITDRKSLVTCADVQLYLECLLWSFCHHLKLTADQVRDYIQAVEDMTTNHCRLDGVQYGGMFADDVINKLQLPV